MKVLIQFCLLFSLSFSSYSVIGQFIIPLYDDIPCANEHEVEIQDMGKELGRFIRKVHSPEIEVYQAENPNGTAVLICPGGGYALLAYDWEGAWFAEWFNKQGITAVVLKYRLPHWESNECRSQVALDDAQRAMEIIHDNADDWKVHSDKIGVMGFSAGGHLASTLSTQYKSDVVHPDFSILMYPVISMDSSFAHLGSRENLIGKNPSAEDVFLFSNELQISELTPPTLLVHSTDDKSVPVKNSLSYYENLIKYNIPSSLLIYESGGHGFGMAKNKEGAVGNWMRDLEYWLKERGLL